MPPCEGWRAAERERRSQPVPYCLCCSAACRPRVDNGWCGVSILDLRLCHYYVVLHLHVCLMHAACVVSVIVLKRGGAH